MSNHPHTDLFDDGSSCLSPGQLEAFRLGRLERNERYRVERHLESCSLCAAALAGFAALPAAFADVPSLQKHIAAKTAKGFSAASWAAGGFAIIAVASLTYILWPAPKPESAAPVSPLAQVKDSAVTMQGEAFIRPGVKPEQIRKQSAAPVVIDTVKPLQAPHEIAVITPIIDSVIELHTNPGTIDNTMRETYNAPLCYILDLKVTDYDKFYKTTLTVAPEKLSGTPAKYEERINASASPDDEMTRTVSADKILKQALTYFNQSRYGKCISSFELLYQHNNNDLNANFYMGVSYVRLELNSNAIPYLDKVINDKNNVFHEEAKWYKALALIGKGDSNGAKTMLQQLVDGKGFYAAQASEKLALLK